MEQNFIEQRAAQSEDISKNEINTLHSEHLTNGEKPIIASVEGYANMSVKEIADGSNRFRIFTERDENNIDYVEYGGNTIFQKEHGFLTDEIGEYSISPVDNKGKVSTGYIMCTGVIGVGKDKERNENISFLSHQCPQFFCRENQNTSNSSAILKQGSKSLRIDAFPALLMLLFLAENIINSTKNTGMNMRLR